MTAQQHADMMEALNFIADRSQASAIVVQAIMAVLVAIVIIHAFRGVV